MFFFNVRILITLWYLQTLLLSTSPPRYTSQSLKRIKLVATSNIWFVQRFHFNVPIISITHPSKPFQSFEFYQRFYIVILASHLNCINESTLFPHPIIGLVCTIRSNWWFDELVMWHDLAVVVKIHKRICSILYVLEWMHNKSQLICQYIEPVVSWEFMYRTLSQCCSFISRPQNLTKPLVIKSVLLYFSFHITGILLLDIQYWPIYSSLPRRPSISLR